MIEIRVVYTYKLIHLNLKPIPQFYLNLNLIYVCITAINVCVLVYIYIYMQCFEVNKIHIDR